MPYIPSVATERILITVRTYPNVSKRYTEIVCTGGIAESGEWRRLFPVPLRYMEEKRQYRVWDIISVRLGDQSSDGRLESRRPDTSTLTVTEHLDSHESRSHWVEPTAVDSLRAGEAAGRTLFPVWVGKVKDLVVESDAADWEPWQRQKLNEEGLFGKNKPLQKLPFRARFVWSDAAGDEHRSTFIAWECGETWRQYRRRYNDPLDRLKQAFLERCQRSDRLAFFVGNYKRHPQHFSVCGVYAPPRGSVSGESGLFG